MNNPKWLQDVAKTYGQMVWSRVSKVDQSDTPSTQSSPKTGDDNTVWQRTGRDDRQETTQPTGRPTGGVEGYVTAKLEKEKKVKEMMDALDGIDIGP